MVAKIILEEWLYLWKNKRLLLILVLVPLVFMVLFGSAYQEGKIRSLPMIYFDGDQTAMSRQIIQAFHSTEAFHIVESPLSEKALTEQIQQGQAVAGIVIPAGFERVTHGEQGELMTIVDGSNIALVNSALTAANEVVQTISSGIAIKRVEAKGLTGISILSLRSGYRMLYNPGLSYSIFMPLGLLGAVVQQVVLLGVSLCIVRHREVGDAEAKACRENVGLGKWLYAKSVPYFLIGLFLVAATLGVLIKVYHFPFVGSIGFFVILSILFVASLLGLGLLVSAFSPNSLQATQISMLLAVLSFPLSGYTWPFMSMPTWLAGLGRLFPLTYFLNGVKEMAVKGNGWEAIKVDFLALFVITLATLALTLIRLVMLEKLGSRKVIQATKD